MMSLNTAKNLTKLPSKSKNYADKGNRISFCAFLLSIFIYISIFYVFNLSPSALFNTTKFWFFISNTLILIIAADFGAFSSSTKQDYYEEFVENAQVGSHIPSSFSFQCHKMADVKNMLQKPTHVEYPREKIKDIIVLQKLDESRERKIEIIVKEESRTPKENQEDRKLLQAVAENQKVDVGQPLQENNNERKCMRSKSEKINLVAEEDEKRIQRSQSERYDYGKLEKEQEENDFSTMSDEELNRRVEEFIQKFNRQIRLQAVRSRQYLHAHEV